ncbi:MULTISPECIES: PQQ-dependent sugar dehydrogenase [Methylomonas]|uniref:Sorbosone dehydrogenase n=1 Tax=Methylomonas koyamae TaxID=702114 RepID=A0A177NVX3_9GAMM|nr:PQQ-dependent sugar dehydrogenase [Methylomonas koyamae]OAI21240.1 sorbosone dehydrogenase [Methylomonas koyamae]
MKIIQALWLVLATIGAAHAADRGYESVLSQLKLPAGFKISIFADGVPNARQLALGDNGTVFVGSRDGNVFAVQDRDGDGVAEQKFQIAQQLNLPNGVAFKNGSLYVAEIQRIIRFDNIEQRLSNPPKPEVVYNDFPEDRHHGWKYLRFGPDGKLYTAVGAPCNICDPGKPIYGALVRLNPDGSDFEILARGIRNTVGFDWETRTDHLFFNDNGRDYLGDDLPPDELNEWSRPGEHFGYPYCHAGTIPDPQLAGDKKCNSFIAPAWKYKAHIAPLGMRFYTGKQFPDQYFRQLFVAQHGSWNRTQPQGYQIDVVKFSGGHPYNEQAFISGWLTASGEVLGRPNDVIVGRDGSLLISDDKLGVIYRVSYGR